MKKERSIPFTTEEVMATFDGRKTQKRIPVKPQPNNMNNENKRLSVLSDGKRKYGKIGDRLYVKETWTEIYNESVCRDESEVFFKADKEYENMHGIKWKSPVTMPKKYARIWLEITDIRAERVQDITNTDALEEGIYEFDTADKGNVPVEDFSYLWDSINEKRGHGWNKNDWVFVIEFKKVENK